MTDAHNNLKLDDIFKYYLQYSEHSSKDSTLRHWRNLNNFYKNPQLANVTRQSMRDYVHHRRSMQIDNSTINKEFSSARAAFNFYCADHFLDLKNPFSKFKLQENDHRIRYLTPNEALRLIEVSTPNYFLNLFIRLCLLTGCRTGEILSLTWDRVDFLNKYIVLTKDHTKTKRRRFVALNNDALSILKDHKSTFNHSDYVFFNEKTGTYIKSLKKSFRYYCDLADIHDFRCHDLRHTFASWLVQAGVPLYTVRDLLGHTCITTTERYAHLQNEHLLSALNNLPSFS